jgi:subtilisin family serine protease
VVVTPVLCADAWPRFETGDRDGYLDAVAAAARAAAVEHDVVVLAQASMADANGRVDVAVPVLSSPGAAVAYALERAGA